MRKIDATILDALALMKEWRILEKQLRANKTSTKAIRTIKRIYLKC